MQVLQCQCNLRDVHLHPLLFHTPELAHERKEVAALHEIDDHIQLELHRIMGNRSNERWKENWGQKLGL
jgi:hypothetical protein